MIHSLEAKVEELLEQRLGAEKIDDLQLNPEQFAAKKADYFLEGRNIILELKTLTNDRIDVARKIIDDARRQSDWPPNPHENDIQTVLRRHPRGRQINKLLWGEVTKPLKRFIKKANRQLLATRQTFRSENSLGVLVVLNEEVDLLDPSTLIVRIEELLGKGNQYTEIDGVILISWAHLLIGKDGKLSSTFLSASQKNSKKVAQFLRFRAELCRAWADFLGIPLQDGGVLPVKNLQDFRFAGRRPPIVL